MSPEQQTEPDSALSSGYLNEKIDIYALGNILYKIAVGNSPWKVKHVDSFPLQFLGYNLSYQV